MPARDIRRLMWLGIALIAATALAALVVSALAPTSAPARATRQLPAQAQPRAAPASGCPAASPREVTSTVPGAASELVPGVPSSALICSYNGLSEPGAHRAGFMLLGERALRANAAVALAASFNALPIRPPYAVLACPNDEGVGAYVYFHYANGTTDPVGVGLQGCSGSSNGDTSREGFPPEVAAVHGSAAFIRAQQGWIDGTVEACGGPAPGRCTPLAGGVRVLAAGGDWNGTASLHHGAFAQRATPGRDLVQYAKGWLGGNPKPVLHAWVTVRGGHTAHVALRLIRD